MKKLLIFISLIIVSLIIFLKNKDDIPDWNIPIYTIESVVYDTFLERRSPIELSEEDGKKLIEAFNNIKKDDIDPNQTSKDVLYGAYRSSIIIQTKNEEIIIAYEPTGLLKHNNTNYAVNLWHEFYDVLREIENKYSAISFDWEEFVLNNRLDEGKGCCIWYIFEDSICIPKTPINQTFFAPEDVIDSDMTIQDILDTYDGEYTLNQVIEYENMSIKIIEIKDNNRVTAVVFSSND